MRGADKPFDNAERLIFAHIAYRRLQMQPNPSRYRAGYLAARAAKDDFAAAFYLNLLPPDERKAILEQAGRK